LSWILDGKREEGTHGYIFIDLVCHVRLGSPEIPDWFGWRQRRSPAQPRQEEEGAADSGVPPISDTGERNARQQRLLGQPMQARGKAGEEGSAQLSPSARGKEE
jgi:hypothetical protein